MVNKKSANVWACGISLLIILTCPPKVDSRAQSAPYHIIIERNVFGLRPPSTQEAPVVVQPAVRSKITITGITSIFGDRRVLLKATPPPGNPGEPLKSEQLFILAEGQSEGDIRIIQVDETALTVTLINAGAREILKLDEHLRDTHSLGPPPPPAVLPVPPGAFAYRD